MSLLPRHGSTVAAGIPRDDRGASDCQAQIRLRNKRAVAISPHQMCTLVQEHAAGMLPFAMGAMSRRRFVCLSIVVW